MFNNGGALSGDWVLNGTHTNNTDSSGNLMYDSKPLFNLTGNTRSTKSGGTYYNSVASLSLTPANFETVYNLHTATNNRDERISMPIRAKQRAVYNLFYHFRPQFIIIFIHKLHNTKIKWPITVVTFISPYDNFIDFLSTRQTSLTFNYRKSFYQPGTPWLFGCNTM